MMAVLEVARKLIVIPSAERLIEAFADHSAIDLTHREYQV